MRSFAQAVIQNAACSHFPGYLIHISWWILRILVEGKYLKAALRHSPVQESAACVSISWLLCLEGWKGRPKRGVKDQFPEAKLGDRVLPETVPRPTRYVSRISPAVNP